MSPPPRSRRCDQSREQQRSHTSAAAVLLTLAASCVISVTDVISPVAVTSAGGSLKANSTHIARIRRRRHGSNVKKIRDEDVEKMIQSIGSKVLPEDMNSLDQHKSHLQSQINDLSYYGIENGQGEESASDLNEMIDADVFMRQPTVPQRARIGLTGIRAPELASRNASIPIEDPPSRESPMELSQLSSIPTSSPTNINLRREGGKRDCQPGLYRLLRKLNVRLSASVESHKILALKKGTIVTVREVLMVSVNRQGSSDPQGQGVETKDTVVRARIDQPHRGWISLVALNGQLCAERIGPSFFQYHGPDQVKTDLKQIAISKAKLRGKIEALTKQLASLEAIEREEKRLSFERRKYIRGQQVEWQSRVEDGGAVSVAENDEGSWRPGRIGRVRIEGTYDLLFTREDGFTEIEMNVGEDQIRLVKNEKNKQLSHLSKPRKTDFDKGVVRWRDKGIGKAVKKALEISTFDDRKMDQDAARVVTTIAGGFNFVEGKFHEYENFDHLSDVAVDPVTEAVFVVDCAAHKIKRISPSGEVGLVAGGAKPGYGDGLGPAARFWFPSGCFFEKASRRLIVTERYNMLIRSIDVRSGEVTTIAGRNGTYGWADGIGTNALFCEPQGISGDILGNIYVADTGNSFIRKVTLDGEVSTVRGIDPQHMELLRRSGAKEYHGEIPSRDMYKHFFASIQNPTGVAAGRNGTVYASVQLINSAILRITPDFLIYSVAGDYMYAESGDVDGFGTNCRFAKPERLRYFDAPPRSGGWGFGWKAGGNGPRLLFADSLNNKIRMVDPRNGETRTVAGLGGLNSHIDGVALGPRGSDAEYRKDPMGQKIRRALFHFPFGIDVDAEGNIFVAETGNHAVRKINVYKEIETSSLLEASLYLRQRIPRAYNLDENELVVLYQKPATLLEGSRSIFRQGHQNPLLNQPPVVRWDSPEVFPRVIVAFDPDHPSPAITADGEEALLDQNGAKGPYLHWIVAGASTDASSGRSVAEYIGPESIRGRHGRHRIVFLMCMQMEFVTNIFADRYKLNDLGGFDPRMPMQTREKWNLKRFLHRNHLRPVSYNFFNYHYRTEAHDLVPIESHPEQNSQKQVVTTVVQPGFLLKKGSRREI